MKKYKVIDNEGNGFGESYPPRTAQSIKAWIYSVAEPDNVVHKEDKRKISLKDILEIWNISLMECV